MSKDRQWAQDMEDCIRSLEIAEEDAQTVSRINTVAHVTLSDGANTVRLQVLTGQLEEVKDYIRALINRKVDRTENDILQLCKDRVGQ